MARMKACDIVNGLFYSIRMASGTSGLENKGWNYFVISILPLSLLNLSCYVLQAFMNRLMRGWQIG